MGAALGVARLAVSTFEGLPGRGGQNIPKCNVISMNAMSLGGCIRPDPFRESSGAAGRALRGVGAGGGGYGGARTGEMP